MYSSADIAIQQTEKKKKKKKNSAGIANKTKDSPHFVDRSLLKAFRIAK